MDSFRKVVFLSWEIPLGLFSPNREQASKKYQLLISLVSFFPTQILFKKVWYVSKYYPEHLTRVSLSNPHSKLYSIGVLLFIDVEVERFEMQLVSGRLGLKP